MTRELDKFLSANREPAKSKDSHRCGFTLVGQKALLLASTEAPVRFLRGTFCPDDERTIAFGSATSPDPDWTFTDDYVTADQMSAVISRVTSWGQPLEHRVGMAGSVARYDVYAVDDTELLVQRDADEASDPHIIARTGSTVGILSCDGRSHQRMATRIVREVMGRLLEDLGYVPFHASMFAIGPSGVLAIGGSGSGKSTLALAMARFAGGQWVANDRVFVKANGERPPIGLPFPLPVALNAGSFDALAVSDYRTWQLSWPAPDDSTDWRTYNGEHKMKLSPFEVEELMGLRLGRGANIEHVVYPHVDCSQPTWLVEKTSHSAVLSANCFGLSDGIFPEDWLRIRKSSAEQLRSNADAALASLRRLPAHHALVTRACDTREMSRRLADTLAEPSIQAR